MSEVTISRDATAAIVTVDTVTVIVKIDKLVLAATALVISYAYIRLLVGLVETYFAH